MAKRVRKAAAQEEQLEDFDVVDLILKEGAGSGWRALGDPGLSIHLPGVIPSGSESLDRALGRGGWPRSRIVLLAGEEGAGKTTLALQACSNTQRMNGVVAFVDAEYKLDKEYARKLGCNPDRFLLKQPTTMEEAFNDVETLLATVARLSEERRPPVLIVFDSINAFVPEAALEGNNSIGLEARVMGARLKNMLRLLSTAQGCLMLVSQSRAKIGVMFGDKTATGCGKGPRFYAATIATLERRGVLKIGDGKKRETVQKVASISAVEISKNQVGPPFEQCKITIKYGEGVDYIDSLLQVLDALGEVKTSGSWSSCEALELKWQGDNQFRELVINDRALLLALVKYVRRRYEWDDVDNSIPQAVLDEIDGVGDEEEDEPEVVVEQPQSEPEPPAPKTKRLTPEERKAKLSSRGRKTKAAKVEPEAIPDPVPPEIVDEVSP